MLKVGLVQLRTPASQAAALAQAEPLVREAAADGRAADRRRPRGPTSCSATAPRCSRRMAPRRERRGGAGPARPGGRARRLAADRLGAGAARGRQVRQPLDAGRPRRRGRRDLRQAAHVRRRPAHRRAHPRVGQPTSRATGPWSPRPPARSSASPSATTCAFRRCYRRAGAGGRAGPDRAVRLHPARPARRTGRCCCAPGRSRPAPSSSRRRRAARTRTAAPPGAARWPSRPGAR